jgi:hypothetical protein
LLLEVQHMKQFSGAFVVWVGHHSICRETAHERVGGLPYQLYDLQSKTVHVLYMPRQHKIRLTL